MAESFSVKVNLGKLENPQIDLTQELIHGADIIAQEMRGNVKRGIDVNGSSLVPNKPSYAKQKLKKLGHARPLIGENRRLVSPSSYRINRIRLNHVRITLPQRHPNTNLTDGQLGYIHNYGLGNNPVREFVGVTLIAEKRINAFLRDRIARLFK